MSEIMNQDIKNQIKKIINDFCDLEGYDSLRFASANSFLGCMRLVGKNVFKRYTKPGSKKNLINLADVDELEQVYDVFCDLCYTYNKEITLKGFSFFSGISYDALNDWKNEKTRTVIYLDINNNVIKDINYYKSINKNNINLLNNVTEVISLAHAQFVKKILIDQENSLANIGISDRNNTGVAMKLNSKFNWNSIAGTETTEKKQALIEAADLKNDLKMLD